MWMSHTKWGSSQKFLHHITKMKTDRAVSEQNGEKNPWPSSQCSFKVSSRGNKVQSNKNSTFEKNQVIDSKPESLFWTPKHCRNFLWAPAGSTQTSHSGRSGLDVDSKDTWDRTPQPQHICAATVGKVSLPITSAAALASTNTFYHRREIFQDHI